MSISFVRSLGAESGVQSNPLQDRTETPTVDNYDQNIAFMCRLTRGRIDKPFAVNKSNVYSKIGKGVTMRASELNEAWVHIVEAVNKGCYEAIIQRLVKPAAMIKYAVAKLGDLTADPISWTVEAAIPDTYLLAVKHLGCHNDGIQVEIHAEEKRGVAGKVFNELIDLVIKDADGNPMYHFTGSLDPAAVDDYQNSIYLPDVVSLQTDAVEVTVGAIKHIATNSEAYGDGAWSKSDVLVCFTEGGTAYYPTDYSAARVKLQNTNLNFGYISSGGSQSTTVINQLVQLAFDANRIFAFDIPGSLSKELAIAYYEQFNIGGSYESSDLCPAYWSPLKLQDPTGINGKTIIGRATLMLAYACRRNAVKNSRGYCEDKRMPVAGRDYPLYNQSITQLVQVSNFDKNDLAKAHINPVIGETYTGGFRYVFFDSLTGAAVSNSKRKLFSVIDMSVDVSERVTRFSKDLLQKDINTTIRRMTDFLHGMRSDLLACGWVTQPLESNPSFATDYFAYSVVPHAYLVDRVEVTIYPCFVGTTRQIALTPILV